MTLGRIIQKDGDFGKRIIGIPQQILRFLDFLPIDIFRDPHTDFFLEAQRQAPCTESAVFGYLLQRHRLMQVNRDVVNTACCNRRNARIAVNLMNTIAVVCQHCEAELLE